MKRKKLKDLTTRINRSIGDAIAGERVIAEARSMGKPIILPGTSKHRIQQMTLRNNVLCVLDKQFRRRQTEMRLKQNPRQIVSGKSPTEH